MVVLVILGIVIVIIVINKINRSSQELEKEKKRREFKDDEYRRILKTNEEGLNKLLNSIEPSTKQVSLVNNYKILGKEEEALSYVYEDINSSVVKLIKVNKACEDGLNKLRSIYKTSYKVNNYGDATEKDEIIVALYEDLYKILNNREQEYLSLQKEVHSDLEKILYEKTQSQKWLAPLIADFLTIEDEKTAIFLETKQQPAIVKARDIREIRAEKRKLIEENKILQYQLKNLLSLFPELESINEFDSQELNNDIIDLVDDETSDEERTKHWLSQEEFLGLSPSERNQRALDNYLRRPKSNWEIGRDFERYVGYRFEKLGFDVTYFGIEKKLEDLGRDLIAENDKTIFVIQCKYWAAEKLIREKHIAQLYGTTILYKLNHETKKEIVPLMVIHSTLSDEAKRFANALGVICQEEVELKPYPMIKCNVGKDGTKIYHLPMDQQYDKVIIEPCKGECYCMTVEDAEKLGFRRAFRWHG